MTSRPRILLVSPIPELHYDSLLTNGGFEVVTVKSLDDALAAWRPLVFNLVLVVVDDNVEQPLEFCEELKKIDPTQGVAFVTGWHTYIPPQSCPDEIIEQEYNPALFIRKVTELSQQG